LLKQLQNYRNFSKTLRLLIRLLPIASSATCMEPKLWPLNTLVELIRQKIFICSADAAFADDTLTRRSSDGYLFQLYGGPIDWRAAKQKTVTTSSTEAELLSLSFAAKEVMWWRRLFAAIQFDMEHEISITVTISKQSDSSRKRRLDSKPSFDTLTSINTGFVKKCWQTERVFHGFRQTTCRQTD